MTFINIMGTLFPVFENVMTPHEKIEYSHQWCSYNNAACWNFNFHFIVGWTVNQIGVDDQYYNVTYTPFVNGNAGASGSLDTGFWKFESSASSHFFQFNVPISWEFEGFERVCYSAFSEWFPYQVLVTGDSSQWLRAILY